MSERQPLRQIDMTGLVAKISGKLIQKGIDPLNLHPATLGVLEAFALSGGYSAKLGSIMLDRGMYPNLEEWLNDRTITHQLGAIYEIVHPKLQSHSGQVMFSSSENVRYAIRAGVISHLRVLQTPTDKEDGGSPEEILSQIQRSKELLDKLNEMFDE